MFFTGNRILAQHIHEAVREAVRALRVLPELSCSPVPSQSQNKGLLASKRCRPKYRNRMVNVRPQRPLVLFPRSPDIQTSPAQSCVKPLEPDETNPESSPSSSFNFSPCRSQNRSISETWSDMEMKMDQCDAAACEMQESVDDREGLGYMVMSPHVSRSSSVLSHDDYVTMASPHKNSQPAYSSSSASLQTSFIRQVFFLPILVLVEYMILKQWLKYFWQRIPQIKMSELINMFFVLLFWFTLAASCVISRVKLLSF